MALLQHCQVGQLKQSSKSSLSINRTMAVITICHGPGYGVDPHKVINVIMSSNNQSPKNSHHNLPGDEVDRPTRPPAPGLQGDLSGEAARREAGNDHQGRPEVMIMMVMMMAMMIIEGGLR